MEKKIYTYIYFIVKVDQCSHFFKGAEGYHGEVGETGPPGDVGPKVWGFSVFVFLTEKYNSVNFD